MPLELSAPNPITFFISLILAVIAVIIHYTGATIPHVHSGFVILLVGVSWGGLCECAEAPVGATRASQQAAAGTLAQIGSAYLSP
jgi:hypothetical protein